MQRGTARDLFELLSSMRFAISLLTALGIASIIGTVVQQNEPFNAYLNQFGPFWFPVFETLGLYSVYSAPWFLVILAFLVLSTSLCIVRQTAPMLREMRSFRERAREVSLRQFAHRSEFSCSLHADDALARIEDYARANGFAARTDRRPDAVLVAARQGSLSRSGYFLAHGAIVLICVGGLLDGDLPLRAQLAFGAKSSTSAGQLIADIPESSRLPESNWSFRGNVFVPEGRSNRYAVLRLDDGILLQTLPFSIALEKFHIEHYDNGSPSRFASDLTITDVETGQSFSHTLEVNRPLFHHGIAIYQSGFEDGGSSLRLRAHSLLPGHPARQQDIAGAIGDVLPLSDKGYAHTLELTEFRAFTVEDVVPDPDQEARQGSVLTQVQRQLGSGAGAPADKAMRNLGPSFVFRLRDEAGQAREFHNYMMPVERDGAWVVLSGVRDSAAEEFAYLRLPLDEDGRLETWFSLHGLVFDPARHEQIASRFAERSLPGADEATRTRLTATARHVLDLFAERGYETVARFIETTVPSDERERALDLFLKILNGLVWEAWAIQHEQSGREAPILDEARARYLSNATTALSDSLLYGAPLYLQLLDFTQRQATVLQVTRSPGKAVVYAGFLLLILGIFAMLYIRERRLFVLLKNNGDVLVALSSNRRTVDVDEHFGRHVDALRLILDPAFTPDTPAMPR